jgi:hypothetical protein
MELFPAVLPIFSFLKKKVKGFSLPSGLEESKMHKFGNSEFVHIAVSMFKIK